MTLPHVSSPSTAEIMERVRSRVEAELVVFYPSVSDAIVAMKNAKKRKSEENPDEDCKTITHLDLENALLRGVAVEVQASTTEAGWSVVVQGVDTEGGKLGVSSFLPEAETEPLEVRSFFIPPE